MSTTTPCRREETALCQPDKTIIMKKPDMPPTSECATMSEQQFLKYHTIYSAVSSWLFAIAGATNIGVLCAFSSKALTAAEQGKPLSEALSNKKYNRIALAMVAFGGACMAISNYLESKKVVTEWQLGANKLNRRIAGAERQNAKTADAPPADDVIAQASASCTTPSPSRNWVKSLQPQPSETTELSTERS